MDSMRFKTNLTGDEMIDLHLEGVAKQLRQLRVAMQVRGRRGGGGGRS